MVIAATLQRSFLPNCLLDEATERLANAGVEERGAIFTRREVVDFMLDLARYTVDRPLHHFRLLEPSFGNGDFLHAAVERLFQAWRREIADGDAVADLSGAITAVEVHRSTYHSTRLALLTQLRSLGLSETSSRTLADVWLVNADFLLLDVNRGFTHVVGNPPYVRQELIADVLMTEYRERYSTIYDRADIYIPFIQRSLDELSPDGTLAFICADRWMKNRYGGPLRAFVAKDFHLAAYVDMVDTPAFHSDVIAYPAIFVIKRAPRASTLITRRPKLDADHLAALARSIGGEGSHTDVVAVDDAILGSEPWLLDSPRQLALVRRLEATLPTLEEAGCKVGIGVATGADKVFIGNHEALPVEDSRKLPLAMRRDIDGGTIAWLGKGVINPFADDGRLVRLADYPRLATYLKLHEDVIRSRNCARNPLRWYRTIDRIDPALSRLPKLLIPDIAGDASVVYENEGLYPHHNLYHITSGEWDLHALQAILRSGIARLFVALYSTGMRGGYFRFQAQYLRRIRLPRWTAVPEHVRRTLIAAAREGSQKGCDEAVALLYSLSSAEREAISLR